MELKDSKEYQRIEARLTAFRLVAKVRTCRAVIAAPDSLDGLNIEKNLYLEHEYEFNGLMRMIEELIDFVQNKTIELADALDIKQVYLDRHNIDRSLYKAESVEEKFSEILKLNRVLGENAHSVCLELMAFYKDYCQIAGPNNFLNRQICDLLACLSPKGAKEEMNYLNNRCTNATWYQAFFFVNPQTKSEKNSSLDALLRSTLDSANLPREKFINECINAYSSAVARGEKVEINRETLSSLFFKRNLKPGTYSDVTCYILGRSKLDTTSNLTGVVSDFVTEYIDTSSRMAITKAIPRLYDTVRDLAGKETAKVLGEAFASHERGDELADYLTSLLELAAGEKRAKDFADTYLEQKSLKKIEQKKGAMTIKKVDET